MAAGNLRSAAARTSTAKDRPSSPTTEAANEPKSGKRLKKRLPPELDPGPLSNEPEMDSVYQFVTISTLAACLKWRWRDRRDYFVAGNLSIYYYLSDPKSGRRWHRKLVFRGPDFFVVHNPLPKPTRNSWVVDNERGQMPNFILEVLSPKTRHKDLGEKKYIYERTFKTPEYFIIDPEAEAILGHRLVRGKYQKIAPTPEGFVWSEQLGMYLGMYDDPIEQFRIPHFYDADKNLIPGAPEEALQQMEQTARMRREKNLIEEEMARVEEAKARAESEKKRVEHEKARVEQEKKRVENEKARVEHEKKALEKEKSQTEKENARLIAKLKALGIDPNT